jgi:hypothetical protein
MSGWTLAAAELRIPWQSRVAAHRMIVIADPKLYAVRQFNGLASWFDRASQSWRCKPIGYLVTDRLRGYDTASHPRTFMPINGIAPGARAIAPAIDSGAMKILAQGLTEADLSHRIAPALDAIRRVNALSEGPEGGAGLPYPFLGMGRNSNSFFSTLLHVMEFDEPAFANPARLVPGAGELLLSKDVLASLRDSALERRSA